MEEGLVFEYPDWANLPSLPLQLISEKLKFITDYVRFRAVCSPWRLASPSKPRHLPHQLPWLMIPSGYVSKIHDESTQELKNRTDDGMRPFYDLWESKMRKIYLPETIGKCCCASYRGWLLIVADKGSELFLLNPLTRDRVDLPPFTTPVASIWDEKEEDVVDFLFETGIGGDYIGGPYFITKVTFSSCLTDPDCIIMVFCRGDGGIFFCRVGDCRWTKVGGQGKNDVAYHNGSFYFLGIEANKETIYIYDLSKRKFRESVYFFKPELHTHWKTFLIGRSGLYLVAVNFYRGEGNKQTVIHRRVGVLGMLKIEDSEGQVEVQRITDNSDTAIFYVLQNDPYLAVCADEWDSLNGASMYVVYTPSELTRNYSIENDNWYNILLLRLNDGESQQVANSIAKAPRVWPIPQAIWFQASFA